MIHYLDPDQDLSLQRFSCLFGERESLGLVPSDHAGIRWHNLNVRYQFGGVAANGGSTNADKWSAAFSAMGEAIERHALFSARPCVFAKTFAELKTEGLSALDPDSFRFFAEGQPTLTTGEAYNLSRDSRINWTWFEDAFAQDTPILLPSLCNQGARDVFPLYFDSTTSGNACGQTAAFAKVKAMLEHLERDAAMVYWWTKNAPPMIDLSRPNQRLSRVLDSFSEILPHLTLFCMRTDIGVTSVMVAIRGKLAKMKQVFAVAGAADLDPISAISRALAEMNQCLVSFPKKMRDRPKVDYDLDYDMTVWDFSDHVYLYAFGEHLGLAYDFMFPKSPAIVHWSELKNEDRGSMDENLSYLKNELKRNGHRLFFRDLANPVVKRAGLHIYRAFSPDLANIDAGHKFRPLGYPRFYTLPKKLGWKSQPKDYFELNPMPHPYP